MPRDNDKDNDSRGRRDRPSGGRGPAGGKGPGGKGRSGAARGPEKKFAKRGFAGKDDGERRPYAGKREDSRPPRRDFGDAPRPRSDRPASDRPQRFNRDDRPQSDRPRGDRPDRAPRKEFRPRDDRGGEKRPYTPRGERGDARPAARSSERKFGDKKPYASRDGGGEKRPFKPRGDRPYGDRPARDGDRPRGERKFGGSDSKPSDKPWQKRDDRGGERPARPPRDGARSFDKPRSDRPRYDKPREGGDERPRFSRSREDRPQGDRPQRERPKFDRPKFDRPRQDRAEGDRPKFDRSRQERGERNAWQEHPRSEGRSSDRLGERPRRENEDDSKVFAKRPAFGGRGAYRERDFEERRPARPPKPKKSGERIAKVVSRAGLASRRDAEEWIVQGRVTVNGRVINSPALDVTENDAISVDGKPLPPRERTRLFLYHKPRGLMTTHADPEGRPTVFDNLPEGLPRLISIGRLDFNTEGLLLLTNDGGLARALELPDTGWLRRYRVRAHGEVTQAQLDELKRGVEVDGVKYGSIDATLERDQGANVWLVFAIREGKNREVRNVMAHLGLEVNRLIRVSYGPFQLAELAEGTVEEVKTRVLRDQLGEKIAALAGADFNRPMPGQAEPEAEAADAPRAKKPFKPAGKSALIADRKGRRVLVQRTGSEEARARNEEEASGYGPPRRPQRGYHGKRDLKPRDE
jgi:23S rRNA pseudouridine2605 synthase